MSPLNRGRGKTHWRSLEELADAPEFRRFAEGEFPEPSGATLDARGRREFLRLMGASVALAGMTACRWPVEEIVPFAHRPEGYVPGVPRSYATAMELDGAAMGLLVTSYDGRPVKIEGNPNHPYSLGATSAVAQASLLELYDPDRSRHPATVRDGQPSASSHEAFESFAARHFDALGDRNGRGLAVLSEPSSSPSLRRMRELLLRRFPEASWFEYAPFSDDNEREGSRLAFGTPHRAHPSLDRADVIVAVDSDFVLGHPAAVRYARDFATGRGTRESRMSRLYVIESAHSLTGSLADHRIPVRPSLVPAVVGRMAAELFLHLGLEPPAGFGGLAGLEGLLVRSPSSAIELAAVRDLVAHRGTSVVVAGPAQPPEVHAAVHLLNAALGNAGRTVSYSADPDPDRSGDGDAIASLCEAMADGRVDTLLILGGNPAFDAPADVEFEARLRGVETSIHLGPYLDETARACRWHVPRAHYLESWGDARAWDGTLSVVQPLISPLWGGRSTIELLALVGGQRGRSGFDIVRESFETLGPAAGTERAWRQTLHDGLLAASAWPRVTPAPRPGSWIERLAAGPQGAADGTLEIVFRRAASVHDGRFANNGWLQEMPDPMTKLTWDNAVLVGPFDAGALGLSDGDVVRVRHEDREIELPVQVMPGQASGSATVSPGYGRRHGGRVADGVGVDVYRIRTHGAPYAGVCAIEKTGGRHLLAVTQDHWAIDTLGARERESRVPELAREAEYRDFARRLEGHAGGEHAADVSLWRQHDYEGHRWAMSIDLNACVGCNACVIACQAENNIPVVGKREVARGHEMHWIRVDRYFAGEPQAPSVIHQPVTCHHCENAPCEQVCPVAATVHDHEGLNVMVYNRCIGTRYCSNNCPYKVRRFNWFNYRKTVGDPLPMVYNPEVTVRSRGVMEKCTFCVQRINRVKIEAKNDGRAIRDGEIVPACAQVCPTRAIVFGDLGAPASRVRELREDPRSYEMLEEQNVRARLRYLVRLRNRVPGGVTSGRPAQS